MKNDTPRTNAVLNTFDGKASKLAADLATHAEELERELTAVTKERDEARGQRDRLEKALRECREDSVELLGERDWWQHEPRGDYQQRYRETRHNAKRADAALQSLNQPEP